MSRYATDRFLEHIYARAMKGRDLDACSAAEFPALQAQKRKQLRSVLGMDKIEALGEDVTIVPQEVEVYPDYALENYDFSFLPELSVPAYVLRPQNPNGRAILYMNGHGPGVKTQLVKNGEQIPFALSLCLAGYTVVTAELVGFGETLQEENATQADRGCTGNAKWLMLCGMTVAGLRVVECQRLLDWFCANNTFTSFGSYGMSGGGMLNTLVFALEPRIDAACIACYPNRFHDSILAMHHCLCNYYPGILDVGEIAHLIALGAPKPVLLSCGDHDPIFPLPGAENCRDTLAAIYARIGAQDQLETEIFDGAHEISTAAVFDFFERSLR